jgi:transposase
MSRMTLLTGPERRRRWNEDEQRQILAAAFAPGAIVADVSRQYEVSTSLIYKWRRHALATESGSGFVPAVVVDESSGVSPGREETVIAVDLAGGARVRISPASLNIPCKGSMSFCRGTGGLSARWAVRPPDRGGDKPRVHHQPRRRDAR